MNPPPAKWYPVNPSPAPVPVFGTPEWFRNPTGIVDGTPLQSNVSLDDGTAGRVAFGPSIVPDPPAPPRDPQYVNTPETGIVQIGVPLRDDLMSRVARLPARLASRLLPRGPVHPLTAGIVEIGAPIVAGILAVWLWRRLRK